MSNVFSEPQEPQPQGADYYGPIGFSYTALTPIQNLKPHNPESFLPSESPKKLTT